MEFKIAASIIHHFYQSDASLGLRLGPEALPDSVELESLLSELTSVYNAKPAKGYASFVGAEDDAEVDISGNFADLLTQWQQQQLSFVAFSHSAARLLHQQLEKYAMLEEGFLLFSHYQHTATDYLTVSFLPSRDGVTIGPDLAVDKSSQLEISRVQLAARIDLSTWSSDPAATDYISFIKGRAGRKVSDFFLDFLGCAERVNAKAQTQQLVEQVQKYTQAAELPAETSQAIRQQAYDYCDEQWRQGEKVQVQDLATQFQVAAPQAPDFMAFTQTQTDEPLADNFPADRATLRKLIKFQGQGGGLSVGFDQTLLNQRVKYDPTTDTLTIVGTPPNLRDQLRRYFGIDS